MLIDFYRNIQTIVNLFLLYIYKFDKYKVGMGEGKFYNYYCLILIFIMKFGIYMSLLIFYNLSMLLYF